MPNVDHAGTTYRPKDTIAATVSPIEGLGVDAVDLAHPPRQGCPQRFDENVIVIVHETPGPDAPVEALAHAPQIGDERLPILIIEKDLGTRVAPRHDVIQSAVELDAEWPGHGLIVVR